MLNKQKITLIIVGAVIIILLFIIFLWPRANTGSPAQSGKSPSSGAVPQTSATMAPVPVNVTVPNEGDKNVSSSVAVPQIQTSAQPSGGSSQYRQFAISADNNAFTPTTIAVKKMDTVDFEITAVDKNYDFTQPDYGFFSSPVLKGETKKVQFQAVLMGKFTFYCASCGGPSKGPIGYIIVTK